MCDGYVNGYQCKVATTVGGIDMDACGDSLHCSRPKSITCMRWCDKHVWAAWLVDADIAFKYVLTAANCAVQCAYAGILNCPQNEQFSRRNCTKAGARYVVNHVATFSVYVSRAMCCAGQPLFHTLKLDDAHKLHHGYC